MHPITVQRLSRRAAERLAGSSAQSAAGCTLDAVHQFAVGRRHAVPAQSKYAVPVLVASAVAGSLEVLHLPGGSGDLTAADPPQPDAKYRQSDRQLHLFAWVCHSLGPPALMPSQQGQGPQNRPVTGWRPCSFGVHCKQGVLVVMLLPVSTRCSSRCSFVCQQMHCCTAIALVQIVPRTVHPQLGLQVLHGEPLQAPMGR